MMQRYTHGGLTWIDLESPSRNEIHALMNEFSIEPLVAEELLLPTAKPRLDVGEKMAYLILHFPALRHTHHSTEQEVDFLVGKNFIITTRYDTIDPLHKFSKVFEVDSMLDKSTLGEHAGYILYYMLKKLYGSVDHEIEFVYTALRDIDTQIFEGKEREMVASISFVGRDLLNLRQAIEPHRDVLHSLESEGQKIFGDQFTPYLRSITNEYYRVHNHIMRNTEALHEMRETNNSLLSTKQSEVMKILTIFTALTFPITIISNVFSMNTSHEPIIGSEYDFWILLALMLAGIVALFFFFKQRRWF